MPKKYLLPSKNLCSNKWKVIWVNKRPLIHLRGLFNGITCFHHIKKRANAHHHCFTGQSWMGGWIASAIHSTYRRIRMLSQIQDSTDETLAALRLHQCSQLQRFAQPLPAAHALAVNQLIERSLLTDVQIRSSLHHYQSLLSFVLVLVYYSISILSSNVAQL